MTQQTQEQTQFEQAWREQVAEIKKLALALPLAEAEKLMEMEALIQGYITTATDNLDK